MSQYEEIPTNTPATVRAGMVPVADGLQMKRRNPAAAWIGLPLITLGIYHLVWYYKIHEELAMFDRRRVVPVAGPMLVLLLLGWTVIAPLVSYFGAGKRIQAAQKAAGLPASCSPGVGLLLMLLGGAGVIYYQVQLNKVTDSYKDAAVGDQVALYV
ncbi:DUF4234 domain-containing protein [Kribbella catacumbae]|uniref:DUF4234 domain-containing protein n=1 Tax=Kribbella catacumbae TaxID=460086 RepID=UPI0003788AF9|nr:DUF4234 domain-containing protein [Kribbella catacumbae]